MRRKNWSKFAVAIVIPQLAGLIGSLFTAPAISGWYKNLIRPELAPPNWIFGPVWTTLFILMGVAAFLVWRKGLKKKEVRWALGIFLGQLVLNTFWSIIFFGLQSPGWAFVDLIFLWLAILATIIAFARVSKPTAWLLLPYIAWVSFAGYLNFAIWQINFNWQSYVNTQLGYSMEYPKTWAAREFPDTRTGAGFRLANSPDEVSYECVTIDARGTAENEYDTSFAEYVQRAGAVEIQNFQELNTIQPVETADGLTGFTTTWKYRDIRGNEKISLPITYFENDRVVNTEERSYRYKTVQVLLNDISCENVYNQMLSTFSIHK